MVAGQLMSFVGIVGKLASTLGVGASVGGAAGGAAAVAGGGATAAVAGFATTLGTVVLPLTAVIGLGYALIKVLEKIGAMDAAKETLREMGTIARYGMVKGAEGLFGMKADPSKMKAFTMGGLGALPGYSGGGSFTVPTGYNDDSYLFRARTGEEVNVRRPGQGMGGGVSIVVNAPNVFGTSKELATALKPSIYDALRQLGKA
jgi:hypothetical protein